MKERKYKEDYSLRSFVTAQGKEKREPVYQGDYFRFAEGTAEKSRVFRFSFLCAALFAAFYFLYLSLNTPSSRCMYVLPVAACALAPLAYWLMGLYALYRAPEKMTRLQKENGSGRILRSATGCMMLLGIGCIGDLIFMLSAGQQQWGQELPGFALLCCCTIAAMGCFWRIRESYNRIITLGNEKGDTAP